MSNPEVDELQQQVTMLDPTSISQKQTAKPAVGSDSPNLDSWKKALSDNSQFLLWHTNGRVPTAWIHGSNLPCVDSLGWWRWCNGVVWCPLITINHHLNATVDLSTVVDHVPFMAQPYNHMIIHVRKPKSSQTGFINMTVSSCIFNATAELFLPSVPSRPLWRQRSLCIEFT